MGRASGGPGSAGRGTGSRAAVVAAGAVVLALVATGDVLAVTAQTWRVRERAEFDKGDPKGVAIGADGTLRLSPRLDLLHESSRPYIWALARGPENTLFASAGNDGTILRIRPDGRTDVLFQADEPEVNALAVDRSGSVFAGVAPGGRIYKIGPDGKKAWVCETGEDYVWALAIDAQGRLFAATGTAGRILKVDAQGRASVFFDSAETHVRALVIDGEGNLIAGTEGHGLIFRVTPGGEGFVLYDAPLREVVALTLKPDGWIYAANVGESGRAAPRPPAPSPSPTPAPSPSPAERQDEGPPPPQGQPPPPAGERPGPIQSEQRVPIGMEGKVLAVAPDGYAREVWSGTQEAILSIAPTEDGGLLMGSSAQGRIYRLDRDETVSEIARIPSSQVTALLGLGGAGANRGRDAGVVAVAGSNLGTVHLLRPGHAQVGSYESRVFDARSFATWGRARWRAVVPRRTDLGLSARCGNTEDPDRTWSDWGPTATDAAGSLLACPASRFIQFRVGMSTKDPTTSPVLNEVTITYLPRNLPPEIKKVEVHAAGVSFQESGGGSGEGRGGTGEGGEGEGRRRARPQSRRGFDPGARSLTWQGSDPNEDDLAYDVYYRAVDETTWKRVRSEIDEEFATLDSTALPDGTYQFRIVGTDARSNSPDEALTVEKVTEPFDVDNTPPRVEGVRAQVAGGTVRLSFRVVDSFSLIREAAWAVDAGTWVPGQPADGLADSQDETYEVTLPAPGPGEHSLVVRASDRAGNTGAGRAVFVIP